MSDMDRYDAGLLNDFGGGNVVWWHDYIRAELERSHEHYEAQNATLRTENTAQAQRIAGLEAESKRLREALLNAQATVLACLEDDARDCSAADHAQGLCNCNALGTILLLRPSPQVQSNPVHVHGAGSECDMDCVEEAARANALSSTPDPQAAPSEPQAESPSCRLCGAVYASKIQAYDCGCQKPQPPPPQSECGCYCHRGTDRPLPDGHVCEKPRGSVE